MKILESLMKFTYRIPVVIRYKNGKTRMDRGKKDKTGDIILFSNQKRVPAKLVDGVAFLYTENDIDFFPVEFREGGKVIEPLPYDLRLRYILEREKIYLRTKKTDKFQQLVPMISLLFIIIVGVFLYVGFDKLSTFVSEMTNAAHILAEANSNMTTYCMA